MSIALQVPRLRWMHLANAGTDHPVFAMLREREVRLTNSSGASATPIAHTVMMQLLAMTRDTASWARAQQAKQWETRSVADAEGRVVGIVGMGAIGAEVARLCLAFGMRPIGLRRTPSGNEPCETWTTDRLHELLPLLDDLVLTAPLTEETRNMIGAAELAMLPAGAHLVNVGRGELIDEPAMIAALESGHLGAAALDVFAVEPLPADSPLWAMPNVLISPHSSGGTDLSRHRAAVLFSDNLARFLADEPLINELP